MGHDDRTGFLSWEWFMVLDRFNPLKWIGLATDQIKTRFVGGVAGRFGLDLRHLTVSEPNLGLFLSNCRVREVNRRMSSWPALGPGMHHIDFFLSLIPLDTMRPVAPRPPRSASSPSSSVSSGSSGSFRRECERSPHTPLPPPAPLHAPGPVHPIPRTPMSDARRYRSLFSRRRVAPPTPPYHSPPPSDEEPSEGTVDSAAELEGDPEEPYLEDVVYPAGYEAYSSDASYGPERESVSVGSAPSSRHSSDDSSGSGSIGYGEASSGSVSDCASDDDLVNRHFAGTFP
ncbi:hypothetical protein PIB30_036137 [Stylosanthes scabra]|uniref:Uncharacterized protein n=1 Tax=Stylosanthes scabra TaxID=79078 RepID=A0ABU6XD04_9FABA|nr:hypothetical protein [Stylosanthes scabra]